MIYLPWRQFEAWQGDVTIRSTGDLPGLPAAMSRAIKNVDPTLAPGHLEPMSELLGGPLAQPRLGTLFLTGFGMVALLLAATGLYGVMLNRPGFSRAIDT